MQQGFYLERCLLSQKCDFKLRIACDKISSKLSIGNALFVKQLSNYDVINEVFDCEVIGSI